MLLDIGVGIFIGIIFDIFSGSFSLGTFVTMGILASLAPDIDYIFHLFRGGSSKNAQRHRETLHNPLFFLIGSAVIALWSPLIALVFAAGVLSHFVHDSIGLGWGVQWLYPFSDNSYAFFYRLHTAPDKPPLPKKKLYVWRHDEVDELQRKHGDDDWIRNIYWKFHPFALFELAVFVIAILTLYIYAR